MADNTTLNPGTGGDVIATDDIGGVKYQIVKISFGALDTATPTSAANPLPVVQTGTHTVTGTGGTFPVTDSGGSLTVDNAGTFAVQASLSAAIPAGDNNIGNVDIVTVPTDPFGANADAASATGSISAKLRFIASTGIPITGTVTVGSHAVTNAGTFVVQENGAALTALQLIDNLVLAEDAAHASGDPGVMLLAVRNDAGTALAGTTGDYIPLSTDANGALRVVGSSGTTQYTEDGASAGGESLCLMGAVRRDTAASSSGTDGDYSTLNTDASGNLRVNVSGGGIAGIVDDAAFTPATSEVLPIGFTFDDVSPDTVNEGDIGAGRMSANRCQYVTIRDAAGNERGLNIDASGNLGIAANSAVNVAQMNGVTVTMGNGASGTGVQRVTLANDSTGVLATVSTVTTVGTVTNITNQGHLADDSAFTPATTRVMMAGFFADETSTDSVDEGDGGAARMTLDRKVIVTPQPHTQGGVSVATGSITNTATSVKAAAGQVYGWYFYNPNASVAYVQFFNTVAGSVTLGTTAPVYSLGIPAASAANVMMEHGVAHSTAIVIGVTTTRAGSTAPGSSVDYNVYYV